LAWRQNRDRPAAESGNRETDTPVPEAAVWTYISPVARPGRTRTSRSFCYHLSSASPA